MALTSDYTVYPRGLIADSSTTGWFRGYDKSYKVIAADNEPTSWRWKIHTFHYDVTFDTGADKVLLVNANTKFSNGEAIMFLTAGTLPTPLDEATVYYVINVSSSDLQVEATIGGGAINLGGAPAGNNYVCPTYLTQNPLMRFRPDSLVTPLLRFYLNGGVSSPDYYMPSFQTTPKTEPLASSNYALTSIFLYSGDNATVINKLPSIETYHVDHNHLFYTSLEVVGSICKAGTTKFGVFDIGNSTSTERSLLGAETNVAIVAGNNIIWSGKILRSTQKKNSLYSDASVAAMYDIECESDVGKMKNQNIKSTNVGSYNAPVGYIAEKIVEPAVATDIDWRGLVEDSLISWEGARVKYSITDADMYSQLMALFKLADFDWRTRNNYLRMAYGASGYNPTTKIITVGDMTPHVADDLIGGWVLFTNSTFVGATPNEWGVVSYGRITDSTTTTLTCATIANKDLPPISSENFIILRDPVLDLTSDLTQTNVQGTFTNNTDPSASLLNCYDFDDKSDKKTLATKIITKGKDWLTGKTTTSSCSATVPWNNTKQFFDHAGYITYKTEGYVKAGTDTDSYLYIYGHEYALQVNDLVDVCYYDTSGVLQIESFHLHAVAEITDEDGKELTRLQLNAALSHTYPVGTILTCRKIYVNTGNEIPTGSESCVGDEKITFSAGGTDATFGPYLATNGISDRGESSTLVYPHQTGCLIIDAQYTEVSPHAGSPVSDHGIVSKTNTVDQTITKSDLDVYASHNLIAQSYYYRKASFWCFVCDWYKSDVRLNGFETYDTSFIQEGDRICVLEKSGDSNDSDHQWQVMSWRFVVMESRMFVELGDYEPNIFTLMSDKTSAIDRTVT
jgi:hypothetical protein